MAIRPIDHDDDRSHRQCVPTEEPLVHNEIGGRKRHMSLRRHTCATGNINLAQTRNQVTRRLALQHFAS